MRSDQPLSRADLEARQLGQLQQLLGSLVPANSFYTAKLRLIPGGHIIESLAEFEKLPFTTKSELVTDQTKSPPFGTNLTFPLRQYTRYHQTSGTTASPLRWLDTPESWSWMTERWMEIFRAAEVDAEDRIVFAFSFGPFLGFWLAFEAATRLGALCLPAGGLSSLGRLRLILDNEATVLCCTPTYALHLAQVANTEKIDLSKSKIRRIMVAGEPGGSLPSTRTRLETAWPGARVFDHHGMTESGPVTLQCPARPGMLHVMEAGYIAEVIDATTGRRVPSGEPGELVLTNLGRTGSPLIRYRTGDLVRAQFPTPSLAGGVPAPCACGRWDVALPGGILGRIDDMVIVRGVNVYPTAVEDLLRSCEGVGEFQVRVSQSDSMVELSIAIEPESGCPHPNHLVDLVKKRFQQAFALRVPVELAPFESLPRFDMKAKRWMRVGSGSR